MEAINKFIEDANIIELLTSGLINLVIALIIFVVGKWIARAVQNTLEKLLRKREVDEVLVDFLGNIVFALVIIVAVVAAFDTLGIPATSFMAIIGAAGLAIGLALKDSLSNFASGVMLVLFRPFTKGNFIEAGGITGTVDEIRLVSTTLTTPDNKLITVPNAMMYTSAITNYSAKDTRRVDMVVGVSYDDDIDKVRSTIKDIIDADDRILKDPECLIAVAELADSSVNFNVRPWVNTSDYWGVKFDFTEAVKKRFDKEGISFPFPQQDVHLFQKSE